jgi:hypothetical protein
MQKPSIRHHTVNRAYLQRFAKNEQLRRVPLEGEAHLGSVNDASVVKRFYTTSVPGLAEDAYEKVLSEVEGHAETAFRHVVDDGVFPPSPEDRVAISQWIAAQFLRTQSTRRVGDEIQRAFSKMEVGVFTTGQVRESLGLPDSMPDEEVEEIRAGMLATAGTRPVDPQLHLNLMAENMPGYLNLTLGRPWTLVRFQRRTLATSDTPVVLVRDPEWDMPLGYGTAGGIFVPLSRRSALMLGPLGNEDGHPEVELPGSTALARTFNGMTVTNAGRVLFHHPDDDPLAGLTLPSPRESETSIDHEHIEALIVGFATQQGRPSHVGNSDKA